ncbi:protein kinase domain-containing protein [Clostridium fungisolvens]|uniref:Serine/threonine-protein kinase PknD n=1 Tax=Clostridium fungisolvens TaxID=1604897 RepID=A0A6V8SEJ6_9CLOT|nr:protein kinase [Clostridium fungisolvens]GFP75490.1 Serine/threonine-protein kinase PknD [Clostridium fungisolvens]
MDVNKLCIACMNESVTEGICNFCGYLQSYETITPNSLPPRTILNGKYMVGKVLGHGGFGITYISWDLIGSRKVAIKEFMPDGLVARSLGVSMVSFFSDEKKANFKYGLEKFLDEARMIYKYNSSPNIIYVYEFFEENGTAYYVMEYLDGMDLNQYLKLKGGKLGFEEMLNLITPVFSALKTIHKDGLIHRDISPDNIYVTKDMEIKLLDFGAARYAVGEKSQNLSVILKLGYAPEEQCRTKGHQGPWTDIYALGATIYHLLTGEKPPEAFERAADDNLIKPSLLGVSIPGYSELALLKAMSVYAKNRFQTVEDFERAFTTEQQFSSPQNISLETQNLSVLNPTPEVLHREQNVITLYAGFWKRAYAAVIDGLIIGTVSTISYYIDGMGILAVVICWLYFSLFECSSSQGTPGKQVMKLIVTDRYGNRISFMHATGRYFSKFISILTLFIGYILAGTTEKKQALHDIIAGTLVLQKNITPYEIHPSVESHKEILPQFSESHDNFQLPKPVLIGISGYFAGVSIPLGREPIMIGRNYKLCQLVFPEDIAGVSGIHCSISYDAVSKTFILIDQSSSFGTFLYSRKRISSGIPIYLKPGETFYIAEDNGFEVRV